MTSIKLFLQNLSEQKVLVSLLVFFSVLFLILSTSTHWTDSELWVISVSKIFGPHTPDFGSLYKPFFHTVIKSVYLFDLSNTDTIAAARWLFALNGLLLVYLTYKITLFLFSDKTTAYWSVFLLLTTSFFLSQGFRVRSDLLAASLQLSALALFLYFQKKSTERFSWLQLSLITFFHLLLILTTPKATYGLLVNFIFFIAYYFYNGRPQHVKRFLKINFSIIFYLVSLLVVAYFTQFKTAFDYFLNSFSEGIERPSYFSEEAFLYVFRFFTENFLHTLILFITFAFLAKKWRSLPFSIKPLFFTSFCCLLLILFHNDRLPFFILSYTPFIMIILSYVINEVLKPKKQWVPFFFLFLFSVNALYYFFVFYTKNNNQVQADSIYVIERYLGNYPGVKYYDGTAILPQNTQILFNIEPTIKLNNKNPVLYILEKENPELVFFSNRMFFYFQETLNYLDHNDYVMIGGGVYAKAQFLAKEKVSEQDIKNLCKVFSEKNTKYYLLKGNDFMTMKHRQTVDDILKKEPKELVACTKYRIFPVIEGMNLAQIFDNDSLY